MKVIKRDGKKVDFDGTKIALAIKKGFDSINNEKEENKYNESDVNKIYNLVINEINSLEIEKINIEEIQDLIEKKLEENGYIDVKTSFAEYRERRAQSRKIFFEEQKQHKFLKGLEELTIKQNDARKNKLSPFEVMVDYGSTISREYAKAYNIRKKFADSHDSGEIHIHNLNFMPLGTTTSSQINLTKLYDEGFNTRNLHIREPQDIMSYAALAVLAINLNQKEQHGCQSIPAFDYYMVPGVQRTFKKQFRQTIDDMLIFTDLDKFVAINGIEREIERLETIDFDISIFDKYSRESYQVQRIFKIAYNIAMKKTKKIVGQGMEAFIHDTNVMNTNGREKTYPSINLGTNTSLEGRMVISKILDAIDFGIQNDKEKLSPLVIFKVKEGVNFSPNDKNYDLYKRAIEIASRRNYPAFSFLDANFNKKFYVEGMPETEVAYNSANIRVMENIIDDEKQIASQRGNLSYTTINLARLGIKNSPILNISENKEKYQDFFNELEEKLDMVKEQLLERFENQAARKANEFPFLIQQGVLLDGDKAKDEDRVRKVIKHGTLAIGITALEECIIALTGESRLKSKNAQKLGLQIVGFIKNKVDEFSIKYNLNFTLMGVDDIDLCQKFIATDKAIYGNIKNVTDKIQYTPSFYVETDDSEQKIKIEAPYHALTSGGHTIKINIENMNVEQVERLIKMCKENNIGFLKF